VRFYRAHFTGEAGHYADAVNQLEALIPELEQADGTESAEILTARRELGRRIASAGQIDRALEMLRNVLADTRLLLGPDHIDVLTTRAVIANCHGQAGDRERALREWEGLVRTTFNSWARTTRNPSPLEATWPVGGPRREASLPRWRSCGISCATQTLSSDLRIRACWTLARD
jgi:hypothetical protein